MVQRQPRTCRRLRDMQEQVGDAIPAAGTRRAAPALRVRLEALSTVLARACPSALTLPQQLRNEVGA